MSRRIQLENSAAAHSAARRRKQREMSPAEMLDLVNAPKTRKGRVFTSMVEGMVVMIGTEGVAVHDGNTWYFDLPNGGGVPVRCADDAAAALHTVRGWT